MKRLSPIVGAILLACTLAVSGCGEATAFVGGALATVTSGAPAAVTVPKPVIVMSLKTLTAAEDGFPILQTTYLSANGKGAFKDKPALKAQIKTALGRGSTALDLAGDALAAGKADNFGEEISAAYQAMADAKRLLAPQ